MALEFFAGESGLFKFEILGFKEKYQIRWPVRTLFF